MMQNISAKKTVVYLMRFCIISLLINMNPPNGIFFFVSRLQFDYIYKKQFVNTVKTFRKNIFKAGTRFAKLLYIIIT